MIGEIIYKGFLVVEWTIVLLTMGLGVFSAISPGGMIKLYQWIMQKLNWRVVPIDEEKEKRNTRVMGLLMGFLAALIVIILLVVA